jgi:hypothetical protein
MDAKEFFDTVRRMRSAQKDYFKTHSHTYLRDAKMLEKAVDDEIQRVSKIEASKQNPKLF